MEDLKPLYKKRDERYNKENQKLLEMIDVTLAATIAYFEKINPTIMDGAISWEDTSLMDDMIVIMGMLSYELGKILDIGGVRIEVTEENLEQLQHMVHMAIPIELVEAADAEKITEYLQSMEAEGEIDIDAIEISAPTPEHEFDLSELSEEQRENLKLMSIKTGH